MYKCLVKYTAVSQFCTVVFELFVGLQCMVVLLNLSSLNVHYPRGYVGVGGGVCTVFISRSSGFVSTGVSFTVALVCRDSVTVVVPYNCIEYRGCFWIVTYDM